MKTIPLMISSLGLAGDLVLPGNSGGIVIFAHGSGSSRFSPRNAAVAQGLHRHGMGTLLFDLLTVQEAENRSNVFDIPGFARRLLLATDAVVRAVDAQSRPIGYFDASTGAAAALVAAAELGKGISAVVSRGGRPDLATRFLESVTAPTLLIVGSLDIDVVAMNQAALRDLGGEKKMALVPGASHLFEEPGTLERVISLAADWFVGHGLGSSGLQHL